MSSRLNPDVQLLTNSHNHELPPSLPPLTIELSTTQHTTTNKNRKLNNNLCCPSSNKNNVQSLHSDPHNHESRILMQTTLKTTTPDTFDSNPSRRRPCRLAAKACTSVAAALLLGIDMATAGLVLEVKPSEYNTGTLQWPIAAGSMAGDYFACAPWAPVSVTTKVNAGDGLSYKAVDFTAAGSILGGPLCPASLGGANPKTIEAWCYQPTGANGDAQTLIDLSRQNGPDNSNYAFCNSTYNRSIWSPPYIEGWNASNAVRTGNWVHLVASYDGTTLNLYFNGAPDKTEPCRLTY
jgi:hypothetical protein